LFETRKGNNQPIEKKSYRGLYLYLGLRSQDVTLFIKNKFIIMIA